MKEQPGLNKCKMNMVSFESDNLIYNRYDLIFDEYEIFSYEFGGKKYEIAFAKTGPKGYINVWGKEFPQEVFERLIDDIFEKYDEVKAISVVRGKNNYKDFLLPDNDIRLYLPNTVEELLKRMKSKNLHNFKKKKNAIMQECGRITVNRYGVNDNLEELIKKYYELKNKSRGITYKWTPEEYVKRFHVTNGLDIFAGDKEIGIVTYCENENIVYFDNFSYNTEYENKSPGFLVYEIFLEEMINKRKEIVYLGGGDYIYKKRFDSIDVPSLSGNIYKPGIIKKINELFLKENINTIAIYGLGEKGREFIHLKNGFVPNLEFGIDKSEVNIEGMKTYLSTEDLPTADAAIITINSRISAVEDLLKRQYKNVWHYNDLIYEL